VTKRERQAEEYRAERIEDARRIGKYLRRVVLPIKRRLNFMMLVCNGATPAEAERIACGGTMSVNEARRCEPPPPAGGEPCGNP